MNLTLVVLAAGIGSRYGGLKQMEPVGPAGEFLLEYSVFDAVRAGFDRVVFLIRNDLEQAFRAKLGDRLSAHVEVDYAFQELDDLPPGYHVPPGRIKPWGTGHAVLRSAEAVHSPFGVINADDFYGRDAYARLATFLRETTMDGSQYAMVGYPLTKTLSDHGSVSRGICRTDAGGLLQSVVEYTKITRETLPEIRQFAGVAPDADVYASMNIWGLKPSVFNELERDFIEFLDVLDPNAKTEFFLPKVIDRLIRERTATVRVLPTTAQWFGITYPEDKPAVLAAIRALVAAGEYPAKLWA